MTDSRSLVNVAGDRIPVGDLVAWIEAEIPFYTEGLRGSSSGKKGLCLFVADLRDGPERPEILFWDFVGEVPPAKRHKYRFLSSAKPNLLLLHNKTSSTLSSWELRDEPAGLWRSFGGAILSEGCASVFGVSGLEEIDDHRILADLLSRFGLITEEQHGRLRSIPHQPQR
jgi:hypothetical protein